MNSPFGLIYKIAQDTGWTVHYILWKVSWAQIQMMLADAPGLRKKPKQVKKGTKDETLAMMKRNYGKS
ncbi:hypothetical protein [Pedobacter arcticus]|uniref:hypothetical protein n=1 Tax=Pedobacter arcticus TaxID=752140 RepID=UPI0002DE3EAD|nr:hypothetical protein [Pedobacter arcticus]